jgi:CRISPR-associated protein Cmr3
MSTYLFIQPLDVLHLRGNRLFGGPGDHAEALMPPWPSVAAGAIRSRMLNDAGVDFKEYAKGEKSPAGKEVQACLGTPVQPGTFRISHFSLGRRLSDTIEPLYPLPADVKVWEKGTIDSPRLIATMKPKKFAGEIGVSFPLGEVPVWKSSDSAKPLQGLWLGARGLEAYALGENIKKEHLVKQSCLWETDPRLGIAMDSGTRSAEKGRIYTSEGVACIEGVGFLAGVQGAEGLLPHDGLIRFGGDGRGAAVALVSPFLPEPPWENIARDKRFRLVLSTPGIFPAGWVLPGFTLENGQWFLRDKSFSCRLVAAAVSRAGVVSGWDLAVQRPKTARRVAATGSVYWCDNFCGDIETLKQLQRNGLWDLAPAEDPARRAEGFNNILIAAWPR